MRNTINRRVTVEKKRFLLPITQTHRKHFPPPRAFPLRRKVRERTACAGRDNGNIFALKIQNPAHVVICVFFRLIKKARDDQRQAATIKFFVNQNFITVRVHNFKKIFSHSSGKSILAAQKFLFEFDLSPAPLICRPRKTLLNKQVTKKLFSYLQENFSRRTKISPKKSKCLCLLRRKNQFGTRISRIKIICAERNGR